MPDEESPQEELLRTAQEVSNEIYYVRSDAAYRVPYGVMQRHKAAIARVQQEKLTLSKAEHQR